MTTARAIFSLDYGIVHCYTIEASYANYLADTRETVPMDHHKFKHAGQ